MIAPTTRETADHAELAVENEDCETCDGAGEVEARIGFGTDYIPCPDCVSRDHKAEKAALLSEIAALRASMEWVDQVQPSNLPWSGAQVEITWDEFNAMRSALGLRVTKPGKPNGHSYNWKKRATQAERQRDELRKALEEIADEAPYRSGYCQSDVEYGPALSADEMQAVARQALANQGAE